MKKFWKAGFAGREGLVRPFQLFVEAEASSSILLVLSLLLALIWANSPASDSYHRFWEAELSISVGGYSVAKGLRDWLNEGLMTLFFLIVGIEIKREMLVGELASPKKALLPVGAAVGGMIVPALIYAAFTYGTPMARGWGIPMATDIAFALGTLTILGRRVPAGLRVFLSAFAIADDLGAVVVIALFYTATIHPGPLLLGLAAMLLMIIANVLWIKKTLVYALLGIVLWLAFLGSGVHATVAGVIIAMCIPARGKYDTDRFLGEVGKYVGEIQCPPESCGYSILLNEKHLNAVQSIELACHHVETPLQRILHSLRPWVVFLIIPVFALANAGVTFGRIDVVQALTSPVTLGVTFGLVLGKPIGIGLFSYLLVRTRLSLLPSGVSWSHIVGAGLLGGIGFTMSLFIASLSFSDHTLLDSTKVGILLASLISAVLGIAFLAGPWAKRKED